MTELTLLAEEVGVSERTLRRAVNRQTLRASRPSSRKLKITPAEKRYVSRFWSLISALQSALRTEQNVRLALLFGSVSRGDAGPESDIDLLVEMRDESLDRKVDLELKLEEILGRKVDVISIGDGERNPVLMGQAAIEGRLLIDREDRWPRIQRSAIESADKAEALRPGRTEEILAGIDDFLESRSASPSES